MVDPKEEASKSIVESTSITESALAIVVVYVVTTVDVLAGRRAGGKYCAMDESFASCESASSFPLNSSFCLSSSGCASENILK